MPTGYPDSPVTTLKLHQLQLIRNTRMAKEYAEHPEEFHLYTADEYIDLVIDFIEKLNPSIVVERFVSQSPKELLITLPTGDLRTLEFTAKVNKRIAERNARQGRLFIPFLRSQFPIECDVLFVDRRHIDCRGAI